ncbi:MAG: DinB family protein [Nocardioides sp.]
MTTNPTWNSILRDQIDFHWTEQLRPRLEGLTDEEYFWEPAPGSWSVRPRGSGTAPVQAGSGEMTIDFAFPEPDPAPVTTISWRLGHVIVGVLAVRNAAHFGREATDYQSFDYAATAADAMAQLDSEYAAWQAGVESLGEDGLHRPVGEAESDFAEHTYAGLALHINRELLHHLAEVCLLRDLHAHAHSPVLEGAR